MSGEKGRLRYLDLYGVSESFPGPDMDVFFIGEEDLAIYSGSFNDSIRLEKIIFPNNLIGIGHSSFNDCPNLVIDDLPETVRSIGSCSFQDCPKLKTVFVPSNYSGKIDGKWGKKSKAAGGNSFSEVPAKRSYGYFDNITGNGGGVNVSANADGTFVMSDVWDVQPFSDERTPSKVLSKIMPNFEIVETFGGNPFTLK